MIACCGVIAVATSLPAETADGPKGTASPVATAMLKQVRVQVEWIEVSHEQLTPLLAEPRTSTNDSTLREQLAKLIKDGKASILETMLCTAPSGTKATSQSNEEFIYPTEYQEPALPCDPPPPTPPLALNPEVGPVPTAFETRNLGSILDIEPTLIDDGKWVRLTMAPEIVYHVGDTLFSEWKSDHGNSPVKMPLIYSLRFNSTITLTPGRPMLAAALSPKNQAGFPDLTRKLMVFVRADVLTPDS